MGDVANLRQARKRVARRTKDETAAVNRAAHGVPKARRDATQAQRALDVRRLDGHKVESPDPASGIARTPARETPDGA